MIASVVRRDEVSAFLTYTLVLAVICALGTIWEYRFHQNLFYIWSDKLLPSVFHVGTADSSGVDELGRRQVRGPAELALEAVAMLSMALPIALVRILQAPGWRARILYGLAACVILAGAISTYRKSAFLAPVAVFAMIAYFRRRDLLRLAPLGLVLLVVIHAPSPGAIGSIASSSTATASASRPSATAPPTTTPSGPTSGATCCSAAATAATTTRATGSSTPRSSTASSRSACSACAAFVLMAVVVIVSGRAGIRSRDPVRAESG